MRYILLTCCVAVALASALVQPFGLRAQTGAQAKIGTALRTTVEDWQNGSLDGMIVSNNADGELRLAEDVTKGTYTSDTITSDTAFNAVGAQWNASTPSGTRLLLELRGGATPNEWGPWQSFTATDAQSADSGALAMEYTRAVPTDTLYLQFRATFSTTVANASPVLSDIEFAYLNTVAGPPASVAALRVPAPFGPSTLTPPPGIVLRSRWDTFAASQAIAREDPRGVIVHQLSAEGIGENPLPFLRALSANQREVLGWDDLAYHFIIDENGTIYEGRVGGPSAAVTRLAGGDVAVHVALLGSGTPSAAARTALADLLAWLGQAYNIPPLGEHAVRSENGEPTTRPNVVTHSEVVPEAADPSPELVGTIGALRQAANNATVRSRWYFAEGNTFNFAERLAVLNTGATPARVNVQLLRQPGPTQELTATVEAGGRRDLVINNVFSDTTDVPAIIEANGPVIAERFMDFQTDISVSPGVVEPSRVWYFAEGTTTNNAKVFLLLFNPQDQPVNATVTYMRRDGTTADQQVQIPSQRRTVVTVGDTLPNAEFGMRVIANQPIVAERTMIFGQNSTLERGGFDSGPGVVTLARRWYFAEGTTQAPFQMNILVLNPNAQRANVAVTFATPDGTFIIRKYAVPPTTQLAINANEVVPELGIATTVESDRPVAAERALFWQDGEVGAVTAGATDTAFVWRFADGRTSDNFQEYLLLNNPNKNQARVTIELLKNDGTTTEQTITMPGQSRYTVAVHQLAPGQNALSATVRATQPIVAERALYPGAPDSSDNRGGATSLGVPERASP